MSLILTPLPNLSACQYLCALADRSVAHAYRLYKPVCGAQHWLTAVLTFVTMPPMTALGMGAFEPQGQRAAFIRQSWQSILG